MTDTDFVSHVLDLFEEVGPARARPMMGGHTVFCREVPVALIADERLYLKVDAATREAFAAAGCEPFTYELRGRRVAMSYYSAPEDALENGEAMRPWAALALEAARRARARKRPAARRPAAASPEAQPPAPKQGQPRRASPRKARRRRR